MSERVYCHPWSPTVPKATPPKVHTIDPRTGIWPIEEWGGACSRGAPYAHTGAPAPAGTKAVVRKISTGRKHRGMSSDGVK